MGRSNKKGRLLKLPPLTPPRALFPVRQWGDGTHHHCPPVSCFQRALPLISLLCGCVPCGCWPYVFLTGIWNDDRWGFVWEKVLHTKGNSSPFETVSISGDAVDSSFYIYNIMEKDSTISLQKEISGFGLYHCTQPMSPFLCSVSVVYEFLHSVMYEFLSSVLYGSTLHSLF